jgi:hypothetical protein
MNTNIARLKDIAILLGDINKDVVFVGGATVGIYIDDLAAPVPQPSEDIDCVVQIATYGEWCDFEAKLREKGFQDVDASGVDINPPTCRKFVLGMKVDFMPVVETVLGYGNPWFKSGLENAIKVGFGEIEINIFKPEFFIASKLKAFSDRGFNSDIRFSQDLEDITELIDGSTKFEIEVINSEENVNKFIVQELNKILVNKDNFMEAMYGFLGYDDRKTREARVDRIFSIINKICQHPH